MRSFLSITALRPAACGVVLATVAYLGGGGGALAADFDLDGDGFKASLDCDDSNPDVYPGAPDVCDMLDNDCDGQLELWEITDADWDSYPICADCDDLDPGVYPGAPERCNGIDDDCDGLVPVEEWFDVDMDGFLLCEDCDDHAPGTHPFADEICDGFDNDCDHYIILEEVTDADGDGALACLDCDDHDINMSPFYGQWETCDGKDNNCDGLILGEGDHDGDGRLECAGDCNDQDADVYGADPTNSGLQAHPEWCDGKDNSCDGRVDEFFAFDAAPPNPNDPTVGLDGNATGMAALAISGNANALAAQDPDANHRGFGVLELINEYDDLASPGPGPSGTAYFRFSSLDPTPHRFSGSYCVDYDFRVTKDYGTLPQDPSYWPVPTADNPDADHPAPPGETGDGFAVTFFDESVVGSGDISDADWPTSGAWGGGFLGAMGMNGSDGQDQGWAVEFDMIENDYLVTTSDPGFSEAHVALDFVGASGVLETLGRYYPDVVTNSGQAGTTDLLAPSGAVATAEFINYDSTSWDPALRNTGWQHAMVSWNPRHCPPGAPPGSCVEPNRMYDADVALWMAEDNEFTMFDGSLLPPSDEASMEAGGYDSSWQNKQMKIGLTAGTGSIQSTYEVDNLHLVCGPCPRFVGPGALPQPAPDWFDGHNPPVARPPVGP